MEAKQETNESVTQGAQGRLVEWGYASPTLLIFEPYKCIVFKIF